VEQSSIQKEQVLPDIDREAIVRVVSGVIPKPPIGSDQEDIAQYVILAALQSGTEPGSTFAHLRAIDAARYFARQAMPGNFAYSRGNNNSETSSVLGQAARRRALSYKEGIRKILPDETKDIFGVTLEDPNQKALDRVEEATDSLIPILLEKCPVTSSVPGYKRNRTIIQLYLEGYTFGEIGEMLAINPKTANGVWRNFFLYAKDFFEKEDITYESIIGLGV
jgi:hypothetical protein